MLYVEFAVYEAAFELNGITDDDLYIKGLIKISADNSVSVVLAPYT